MPSRHPRSIGAQGQSHGIISYIYRAALTPTKAAIIVNYWKILKGHDQKL
jgi:hypothetical protein